MPRLRVEQTERPGERHEPLVLDEPLGADVSIAADALRLPFDICARLLIERRLAVEAIAEALGEPPDAGAVASMVGQLDVVAERARARCELSASSSAYAQTLLFGLPGAGRAGRRDVLHVAVPMRLLDRIDAGLVRRAITAADVVRARDWELAALLAGASVSEWASLTALRATPRS